MNLSRDNDAREDLRLHNERFNRETSAAIKLLVGVGLFMFAGLGVRQYVDNRSQIKKAERNLIVSAVFEKADTDRSGELSFGEIARIQRDVRREEHISYDIFQEFDTAQLRQYLEDK